MFGALRGERGDACISDLRFDAWHGQELARAQVSEIEQHVRGCNACRARTLELERARARFGAEHAQLPAWLSEPRPRTRHTPWIAMSALGAAAAAAALLAVGLIPSAPEIRSKGRDYVSFYVKRGADVTRGREHETVYAGDQLRFAYTALAPRYLTILSLDGAGRASVYYPAAERASFVDAGADVPLPSAVELDEALGEERIVALFCERPEPIAPLLAALASRRLERDKPRSCTLDELIVIKRAGTP